MATWISIHMDVLRKEGCCEIDVGLSDRNSLSHAVCLFPPQVEQVGKQWCVNSHCCRNDCASRNGTCACVMYVCVYFSQFCVSKFVFPMSSPQMIHEDGGSRSKGSPAGKILLQFIAFNPGTNQAREGARKR